MLVLSRRIGEEIIIQDNIRVRLLSVTGNQVRLGVTAPEDVSIWREELVAENPALPGRRPFKTPAADDVWDWAPHGPGPRSDS